MKTAPVLAPPRPPRNGKTARGAHDGNGGDRPKSKLIGRAILKFFVLLLFAVAIGQLGLIIFKTVQLSLAS